MRATARIDLRPDLRRMAASTSELREEASNIVEATTREQWNWSPDQKTWSMALVVDHLNSVSRLQLPLIDQALAQLREDGLLSDIVPRYNLLEQLFIRMVSPNPPFR